MFKFGKSSSSKVSTCVPEIQLIAQDVLGHMDITCIYGKRNKEEQDNLVELGRSKLSYPHSAHNSEPLSMAGDFAPWSKGGVDWSSLEGFCRMRELFSYYAGKRGYTLKPLIIFSDGTGDWPHIELALPKNV